MFGKTIVMKFSKLISEFQEKHLPIYSVLFDDLERENLCEIPILPEERLGICLYHLSHGDYYQTMSELTGCGIATVRNITQEVSNVVVN